MKGKILLTILLTLGLITGLNICFANTDSYGVKAKASGTVIATSLNVRTGPGTTEEILQHEGANVYLKQGEAVSILTETNGWFHVSFTFGGKALKGYVLGDFVQTEGINDEDGNNDEADASDSTDSQEEVTPTPTPTSTTLDISAKINATTLKVRKTASATGTQLSVSGTKVALKKGTEVTILKEKIVDKQKWYYISFTLNKKNQKGYVLSDYVKLSLSKNVKAVVKSSKAVSVRKGAGTDKDILKVNGKTVSLKNKQDIVITLETADSKGNKWYKVSYLYNNKETRTGYILGSQVTLKGNVDKTATVTASTLNVRKTAGTTGAKLTYNKAAVALKKGEQVAIASSKKVENVTWYKVSFDYSGTTLTGFVSSQYVSIDTKVVFEIPKPTEAPPIAEESPEPEVTESPIPYPILDDVQFDWYLTDQGFPDSYKQGLAALHASHPNWIFKAYNTGLDWNTVIENESKVGLNLISKNKTNGWLSYEAGAYDWATDTFKPYDGSTWVTASKAAVEYYMDPRNFLYQNSIFQFESLENQSDYQIQSGVEAVLRNSPMSNATITYLDENTGEEYTKLYSEVFMDAARESGVSPYHLATRVKQEVIRSATAFSDSVTGTVVGYEGYYNYYNIGATHSTVANGAIINGLKFAMGNTISSAATKATYLLPWNNPYKAIVGGAKYIGTNYINRGQNNIYLQKFNITPTSTYTHQYMANVEAANSEAAKTYTGYNTMGMLEENLVFNIPVYYNMPEVPGSAPQTVLCPNNWLKTLKLDNYTFTPKFNAASGGTAYCLTITDSNVNSLNLAAATANSRATMSISLEQNGFSNVLSSGGSTVIPLAIGTNVITIQVMAENGDMNYYTITVTKTS